ncbi:MAG: GDP-mannose 4,6-dehydratase [Lentisphaerae bacterium]|nr:GDP-mannose 4,6-dehydratase [Lentisphaerota bacterium]
MGRYAVIGSNSFSGSNFIAHLLKDGHDVVGISRSAEIHPVFLPYAGVDEGSFRFCQMDLNRDLEAMISELNRFRPDYVVNYAAQSMVGQSWDHPEHWFQTNAVATVMFHDRLRSCDWLKRYVHISTPEVYGSCSGLVHEHHPFNPSTPYAVSRAAADMSLASFVDAYAFPVVSTRAANVFGAHQQLYRIIPRAALCFLTNQKLQLQGGGTSVRSFIHIDDVSRGTQLAAEKGAVGAVFHLATDRNISIRALVELVADQLSVSFEDHVDVVGDRLGKDSAYLLDCTAAKERLGWASEVSLEQGVDRVIGWVRDNLDELLRQPQQYVHKA